MTAQVFYCFLFVNTFVFAHRSEVELKTVKLDSDVMSVMAFGDWGVMGKQLKQAMRRFHTDFSDKADAVFLLGDNFYPSGISHDLGVRDPQFNLFRRVVAKNSQCPYYAILGNHDTEGDVWAQVDFSEVDRRWYMPSRYYFQKFQLRSGAHICTWFLDTEQQGSGKQLNWLDKSIRQKKKKCTWLIVVGHHPVHTAGEYHSITDMKGWLLPVLQKHHVHLYLSGHEHQSQVLIDSTSRTTFIIAGAIADLRYGRLVQHPMLQWGNSNQHALLSLHMRDSSISYAFHSVSKSRDEPPMYSGVITK